LIVEHVAFFDVRICVLFSDFFFLLIFVFDFILIFVFVRALFLGGSSFPFQFFAIIFFNFLNVVFRDGDVEIFVLTFDVVVGFNLFFDVGNNTVLPLFVSNIVEQV